MDLARRWTCGSILARRERRAFFVISSKPWLLIIVRVRSKIVSLSAFLPSAGVRMFAISSLSLMSSLASGMRAVELDSSDSVSIDERMAPRRAGVIRRPTMAAYFLESRFLMIQMITGARSSRVSSHCAKREATASARSWSQR